MTLDDMCIAAARYSDRYDEFEKTQEGGTSNEAEDWYEDDALHYFYVFRDGINEAYREVSKLQAMPDMWVTETVQEGQEIDLSDAETQVYAIKKVMNANRTEAVQYDFVTKYVIKVDAPVDSTISLLYHYMPDPLEYLDDSPVFTEAWVDPMLYISLAVARMWYSEKKFDFGNQWMSQYYSYLRNVRSSLKDRSRRRIPRGLFR